MKVRKRLVRTAAKIYAANLLRSAMASGSHSELLSDKENDLMDSVLQQIGDKISLIDSPTIDDCVKDAIEKLKL